MNLKKVHWIIDWCIIISSIIFIVSTSISTSLWWKVFPVTSLFFFCTLNILFLNQLSIKSCFKTKDKEFFLVIGGIILTAINMILVRSRFGAFFTVSDFLLLLYLSNKVRFDKIQLGSVALICFFLWFYWQFINKSVYPHTPMNPNQLAGFVFSFFCIFICYVSYLASYFQIPKWIYSIGILLLLGIIFIRVLSFECRGVLAGLFVWCMTYYFLPKKKYTIFIVIGTSLFIPIIYVLLWKSGFADHLIISGKRFFSGRDIIWYEFFNAFIKQPITGIGSDFDRVLPNLYMKEVHHALLDLLFVHGLPVFIIVLYLMYKRIAEVVTLSSGPTRAVCLASIYGFITTGTFENFYILFPYNFYLLIIFVIAHSFAARQAAPLKSQKSLQSHKN